MDMSTSQHIGLEAHTHTPILARSWLELAVESADSTTESADSTIDSVIIGRLSLLNRFNILNPLESVDGGRPTIRVGRWKIALVGTDLEA